MVHPEKVESHFGLLRQKGLVISCAPKIGASQKIVKREIPPQFEPRLRFLIETTDIQRIGQFLVWNDITCQIKVATDPFRKSIGSSQRGHGIGTSNDEDMSPILADRLEKITLSIVGIRCVYIPVFRFQLCDNRLVVSGDNNDITSWQVCISVC